MTKPKQPAATPNNPIPIVRREPSYVQQPSALAEGKQKVNPKPSVQTEEYQIKIEPVQTSAQAEVYPTYMPRPVAASTSIKAPRERVLKTRVLNPEPEMPYQAAPTDYYHDQFKIPAQTYSARTNDVESRQIDPEWYEEDPYLANYPAIPPPVYDARQREYEAERVNQESTYLNKQPVNKGYQATHKVSQDYRQGEDHYQRYPEVTQGYRPTVERYPSPEPYGEYDARDRRQAYPDERDNHSPVTRRPQPNYPSNDGYNKGGQSHNQDPSYRPVQKGSNAPYKGGPSSLDDGLSVYSEHRDPEPSPRRPQSFRWQTGNTSSSSRMPRPKFNLKTFGRDESYTIDEFISVMNDYVQGFEADSPELMASIKSHLTGEAASVVLDADCRTWEEIKEALLMHYRPDGEDRTHMATLMSMKRKSGETPSSLAVRIRTSTRKAYPHLKIADLDSIMIQHFLTAIGDKDLNRTVLSQDIRAFRKVVEVSTRLSLADGIIPRSKPSKPPILHFQEQRQGNDADEATLARINKLVESRVDDALAEKGRSRSRDRWTGVAKGRDSSNGRRNGSANRRDNSATKGRAYSSRPASGDRNVRPYDQQKVTGTDRNARPPRPYSGNRDGSRDRSRDRRPLDQSASPRPRSDSRTRSCFKCHGLGHFIADCPSTHWYLKDGRVDVDRDILEARKAPNGQGTTPRP